MYQSVKTISVITIAFVIVIVTILIGGLTNGGPECSTLITTTTTPKPIIPACAAKGYQLMNGLYCYKFNFTAKVPEEQASICRSDGTKCHLVTIDTEEENTYLAEYMAPLIDCSAFYTSAFRLRGPKTAFDWREYDSGNYKAFGPNHFAAIPPADPDLDFYLALNRTDGGWVAVSGDKQKYCSICECDD